MENNIFEKALALKKDIDILDRQLSYIEMQKKIVLKSVGYSNYVTIENDGLVEASIADTIIRLKPEFIIEHLDNECTIINERLLELQKRFKSL